MASNVIMSDIIQDEILYLKKVYGKVIDLTDENSWKETLSKADVFQSQPLKLYEGLTNQNQKFKRYFLPKPWPMIMMFGQFTLIRSGNTHSFNAVRGYDHNGILNEVAKCIDATNHYFGVSTFFLPTCNNTCWQCFDLYQQNLLSSNNKFCTTSFKLYTGKQVKISDSSCIDNMEIFRTDMLALVILEISTTINFEQTKFKLSGLCKHIVFIPEFALKMPLNKPVTSVDIIKGLPGSTGSMIPMIEDANHDSMHDDDDDDEDDSIVLPMKVLKQKRAPSMIDYLNNDNLVKRMKKKHVVASITETDAD